MTEYVVMLFSRRLPEVTTYDSASDITGDPWLSLVTRAWMAHLFQRPEVKRIVVIPRSDLDSCIEDKPMRLSRIRTKHYD